MNERRLLLLVTLAVSTLCFSTPVSAQHGGGTGRRFAAKLLSPKAGDVFSPGEQVLIKWEKTLPDVDLSWCEVEIYLSIDGGRTNAARITPQLDAGASTFTWTVPNLPTNAAVLDIHFGCEANYPESPSVQAQSLFIIRPNHGANRGIDLNVVSLGEAYPGSSVQVSWSSSLEDVALYELQISYDRGAHFHKVVETKDQQYIWDIPQDFAGHATFRVVAHTTTGERVDSPVSALPQVVVRARTK